VIFFRLGVPMSVAWNPAMELSKAEQMVAKRLKRTGKLFVFLREHRHSLFDDAFQQELMGMYSDMPRGTKPKAPALLAMATLLQAYEGASDAAAVENAVFDRRWQMVLDCMGTETPPFSQGALVDFRQRLIANDMDRRLLERTVELAKETGGFGHKALKVALDSAPLAGAGRVEDTFNLIGHALDILVRCVSGIAGISPEGVRQQAGTQVIGGPSLKGALDIDWDDPEAANGALARLLMDVKALRSWVQANLSAQAEQEPLQQALRLLDRVLEQDLEPDPDNPGRLRIRDGTAKERRISIEDGDMRHGRKSRSRVINGFKNHIAVDVETGLTLAASVRPANEREHMVEEHIRADVERHGEVAELHIDRGYLSSRWASELHSQGRPVYSRPWVNKRATRFTKADFRFDFERRTASCPGGETTHIREAKKSGKEHVTFPSSTCRQCPIREQCIPREYTRGRTITLHPTEALLQDLRDIKASPEGRKKLRLRVVVEHRLAHLVRRQGRRARYVGLRKNTFDSRRVAAVENLHCAQRYAEAA
jgi:hypothetical protein